MKFCYLLLMISCLLILLAGGCGEIVIEDGEVAETEIMKPDPITIEEEFKSLPIKDSRFEDVLIYIGTLSWILPNHARAQSEITERILEDKGFSVTITTSENYVEDWVLGTWNNDFPEVLMLYGIIPSTIYPPTKSRDTDNSLAERWIESTDGNMIFNQADWLGYYADGRSNRYSRASGDRVFPNIVGPKNGQGCLQSLMDNPIITMWGDNTPVHPTINGETITPSLVPFISDRPFRLEEIKGTSWRAEIIFGRDDTGNRADPVIVRDGNRGRIGIAHMTDFRDDPKGEVAAEMILYIFNKER